MIDMKETVPDSLRGGSLLTAHNWVRSKLAKRNPSGSVNYTLSTPEGAPVTLSDLTSLNTQYDEVIIVQDQSEHIATNPKSRDTNFTSSYKPGEYNPFEDKKGRTGSQRLKSAYPIPVPDYGYPSYNRPTRTGNNLVKLLPIDVSADMVERLIAQQGTFQAIHTLNKLSYDFDLVDSPDGFTDPSMAALLQRYANALTKENHVRLNPGKPYTSNQLRKHRGLVSPREAVKEFVQERFGIENLDQEETDMLYKKAQLNKEYDMDNGEMMDDFVINALVPYLAVAPANRAMLQALSKNKSALNVALVKDGWLQRTIKQITPDVMESWSEYLGRQGSGAKGLVKSLRTKDDDPVYSNIVYQKLLDLTPLTAEDFYHGMDFAIAAHPLFMTPSGQVSGVDKEFIRQLFTISAQAPMSLQTARTAEDLQYRMSIPGRLIEGISSALGYEGWSLDELQLNKLEILNNDELLLAEGPLNVLSSFMNRVEEADSKAMSKLKPGEKFTIVEDGFGCQPTVPPFWPAKIVYSVMDVISDNIDDIRSNRTEIDRAMDVLRGTHRSSELLDYPRRSQKRIFSLDKGVFKLNDLNNTNVSATYTLFSTDDPKPTYETVNLVLNTLKSIIIEDVEIAALITPHDNGMITTVGSDLNVNTNAAGLDRLRPFNNNSINGLSTSRATLYRAGDRLTPAKRRKFGLVIRWLLGTQFKGSEFDIYKQSTYWNQGWGYTEDKEKVETLRKLTEITDSLTLVLDQLHDKLVALPVAQGGTGTTKHNRVIPFLTLFMQVEELTRNKYDYNMSEKERGFALWLLEGSLKGLDTNYAVVGMGGAPAGVPQFAQSTIKAADIRALEGEFRRLMPGLETKEQEKQAVRQMMTYTLFHQMLFGRPDGLMSKVINKRKRENKLWKSDWAEVRGLLRSVMGSNPSDVYVRLLDRIENVMTRGIPAARQRSAPQGQGINNDPEYNNWVNAFRINMNNINQRSGGDFGISPFTKAQEKMMREGFRTQTVNIGGTDLSRVLDKSLPRLNRVFVDIERRMHANIRETVPLVSNIISRLTNEASGSNITNFRNDITELQMQMGDVSNSNHSHNSIHASLEAVQRRIEQEIRYQNASRQLQNVQGIQNLLSRPNRLNILEEMKNRTDKLIAVVINQRNAFNGFKNVLDAAYARETVGSAQMEAWIRNNFKTYQDRQVQLVNWDLRYEGGMGSITTALMYFRRSMEMLEQVALSWSSNNKQYVTHRSLSTNMDRIQDAIEQLLNFANTLETFNLPVGVVPDTIPWYETAMMQQIPAPAAPPNRQAWTVRGIKEMHLASDNIATGGPGPNQLVVRNQIQAFNV